MYAMKTRHEKRELRWRNRAGLMKLGLADWRLAGNQRRRWRYFFRPSAVAQWVETSRQGPWTQKVAVGR